MSYELDWPNMSVSTLIPRDPVHSGQFMPTILLLTSTYYVEAPSTFNEAPALSDYLSLVDATPETLPRLASDGYLLPLHYSLAELPSMLIERKWFGASKLNAIMKEVLMGNYQACVEIIDNCLTWMHIEAPLLRKGLYIYFLAGWSSLPLFPIWKTTEKCCDWLELLKSANQQTPLSQLWLSEQMAKQTNPHWHHSSSWLGTVEQIIALRSWGSKKKQDWDKNVSAICFMINKSVLNEIWS